MRVPRGVTTTCPTELKINRFSNNSDSDSDSDLRQQIIITMATLRALGFCGVDDSVDPNLLGIISNSYPFVEFGVLFRPDKVKNAFF